MTINEAVMLLLAATAGMMLGAIFFGGLWWTIRRGARSPSPVRWFVGSLLLRVSITLTGFYFVGADHWQRLLACLLGFVIARLLVTRLAGPPITRNSMAAKEPGHAAES